MCTYICRVYVYICKSACSMMNDDADDDDPCMCVICMMLMMMDEDEARLSVFFAFFLEFFTSDSASASV